MGDPPPAPLAYSSREQAGVLVVTVAGDLDVFSYVAFRTYVTDQLLPAPRGQSLVLDLTGLAFLDSTGLGVLVHLLKRVRARGGAFGLAGANKHVTELLRITGLRTIIPSAGTVEDAVTGILRIRPGSP